MKVNRLFLGCFLSLIATAFGFIIRAMIMDEWAVQFGLSETQKGEIFGVGLWPFAISIVLFSLVIDRVGYGKAMVFAFICHVASAIITICAPLVLEAPDAAPHAIEAGRRLGYWMLYLGNLVVALGNGTVEAVINPVVATMYSREKTKWLNILHAGWPGGLVLGGLIVLAMGPEAKWEYKVALIFIPIALYAVLLIGVKFPVSERVAAGVSYREMLSEFGIGGAYIVSWLIVSEVTNVFSKMGLLPALHISVTLAIAGGISLLFGLYCRSFGRPIFVFLLLVMIPLATTELGTDSWITPLMEPEMEQLGMQAGWVLVYTSAIMMILRFFAGPIVHRLSPLGLLATSALLACLGLLALSKATGVTILAAATLYGFGKTFFWPTMLGIVAEQFPKGGALTLNVTGGVGMLGVGVVGAMFLGLIQDKAIHQRLETDNPALAAQLSEEKHSVLGSYVAVNPDKVKALPAAEQETIKGVERDAKKGALATVAIFPAIMLACYLLLIAYYRSQGGYQAQVLTGHAAHDEEFTGGVPGPMEA